MRCRLGKKKLQKYSKMFNIVFVSGLVRGNTNHRVDLFTEDEVNYSFDPREKKFYKKGVEIRKECL